MREERVLDEEATFKVPKAMRHSMDHKDIYYLMDGTNMIFSNCMQEV